MADWQDLRFGVEIEFVGGEDPSTVELLPGWIMSLDEHQVDGNGEASGSELKPPPMLWRDRAQICAMLARLRARGARANWSCGLHVHVGLSGQGMVLRLVDAALAHQDALRQLLQTAPDRLIYCPPVTAEQRRRYLAEPGRRALVHRGRPQSHRCGINTAAWFDIGTVEIRYANGSLDDDEVLRTIELCLRFVAAVGAGVLPAPAGAALAAALGAPAGGYPPPQAAPLWYRQQAWLEEALIPVLAPLVPEGEILHIRPVEGGCLIVDLDPEAGPELQVKVRPLPNGWERA